MKIGDRIKKRRQELNLTLEEIAKKLNTSRQAIFKYENNIIMNIPPDKVEQLASVLKTSPAYLMGWEEKTDFPEAVAKSEEEKRVLMLYRKTEDIPEDMRHLIIEHFENTIDVYLKAREKKSKGE